MDERSSSSPASASQDDGVGLSDASLWDGLPDAGTHPVGSNKRLRTAYSAAGARSSADEPDPSSAAALEGAQPLSKSES